jgi:hypothetical protein
MPCPHGRPGLMTVGAVAAIAIASLAFAVLSATGVA